MLELQYFTHVNGDEQRWSKLKTALHTAQVRTLEVLEQAITLVLATSTVSDDRHWFHHCSYALQWLKNCYRMMGMAAVITRIIIDRGFRSHSPRPF